ncbi:NERD domain-containing protein [Acidaminobacter hydrogenoformans]|uniref:HRDC domain-containing protein n=1 Tax=Acidaminobacter hydrogenoformans DSM 2784 TaxID=1120920 RepID=A0A1G5S789_9FIRM|nr:NERD domain-containing protein [Acidaminobacter hydrogenoformans]SCZ81581.1 HRDC domain-containing protein [Acidaminobacter hydrogenoformans DSM 2784]
MGIFDKMNGPVFLKESSDASQQLEQLNRLHQSAAGNVKKQLELDMKLLSYGISGEETIAFELKNSFMPMVVLHDLFLEHEGLTAQIDYLVVTKKKVFVIECKNLFGNIEVNSNGDFIRSISFNGKVKKEGIYSPITQNQRHMDLLRKLRKDDKSNLLSKMLFDTFFEENYQSIVVLANQKTVINMKYAKKDVKEKIIRSDQLIDYMKRANSKSKNEPTSDKKMLEIAESYLGYHKEKSIDYSQKYQLLTDAQEVEDVINLMPTPAVSLEETEVYKRLKEYRLKKSREENIKAYYIYNNVQMEELIRAMPKTIEEMMQISGFGEAKCAKYGEDILGVLEGFR